MSKKEDEWFLLSEDEEDERPVSLKENLSIIKQNLETTLDPKFWPANTTQKDFEDVLSRNKALIAMMSVAEKLHVKSEEEIKLINQPVDLVNPGGSLNISNASAAYMAMGGRVSMQFEPEICEEVFATIYGFDSAEDVYKRVSVDYDAPTEDRPIAPRFTSSHKVGVREGSISEKRGFFTGLKKAASSLVSKKTTISANDTNTQFGLNLALFGINNETFQDVRFESPQYFAKRKRATQDTVAPDGSFGHLLSVVNAKDGVMMLGIEKAAYGCESAIGGDASHDLRAKSGNISCLGAFKHRYFDSLEYKALGLAKPMLIKGEPIGSMVCDVDEITISRIKSNQAKYETFARAQFQALKLSRSMDSSVLFESSTPNGPSRTVSAVVDKKSMTK